jgi:hypothetical protein
VVARVIPNTKPVVVTRVIPHGPFLSGVVVSLTPRWRTLSVRPNDAAVARMLNPAVFFIGADAMLDRNGKACELGDIQPGDPIRVAFRIEPGPTTHVTGLEAGDPGLANAGLALPVTSSQLIVGGIGLAILFVFMLALRGVWRSFSS